MRRMYINKERAFIHMDFVTDILMLREWYVLNDSTIYKMFRHFKQLNIWLKLKLYFRTEIHMCIKEA